jgi:hypothetical protein
MSFVLALLGKVPALAGFLSFKPSVRALEALLAIPLALVLLPKLVVVLLFVFPLPVRLCKEGSAPSAFSLSALRSSDVVDEDVDVDVDVDVEDAGIAECRRALLAALASSLTRARGLVVASAGEESVKSNTAKLSFSCDACFTAIVSLVERERSKVLATRGSETGPAVDVVTLLLAVLVSVMSADMALEVVDRSSGSTDAGDALESWFRSSFCLNGLPASASSSPLC